MEVGHKGWAQAFLVYGSLIIANCKASLLYLRLYANQWYKGCDVGRLDQSTVCLLLSAMKDVKERRP